MAVLRRARRWLATTPAARDVRHAFWSWRPSPACACGCLPAAAAQRPRHADPRGARARDPGFRRPVRVVDLDPGLLSELDADTAHIVRARGVADSLVLRRGCWTPPAGAEFGPGAIGLLVLDGLLTRSIRFAGHESPELVGAGDLLRPWEEDDGIRSLAFNTEWRVLERTTVALLDARFAARICCAPALVSALLGRTLERSRWLSFQLAIAHVRRAEPRVQMLLICAHAQRQAGGAWAWLVVAVVCARTPSLISVLVPGWLRSGDMMVDGVSRGAVRPLGL